MEKLTPSPQKSVETSFVLFKWQIELKASNTDRCVLSAAKIIYRKGQ